VYVKGRAGEAEHSIVDINYVMSQMLCFCSPFFSLRIATKIDFTVAGAVDASDCSGRNCSESSALVVQV